jgi:hypothetical protein
MKLDKGFARMIRASPSTHVCDVNINLLRKDETMMCDIVVGPELVHDGKGQRAGSKDGMIPGSGNLRVRLKNPNSL